MPVLQTNELPIRTVTICDGWCIPPCWERKTPPWLWCDAKHDFVASQVITGPNPLVFSAMEMIARSNEHLFVFYEIDDLEGARRCKERIANIRRLLDKLV